MKGEYSVPKICLAAAVTLLAVIGTQALPVAQATGCKEAQEARVVRLDDRQRRVFLRASSKEIASAGKARALLQAAQGVVGKCRPSWGEGWSASFFSEPKYAGYKDEPRLLAYVADGSWGRSYVGEYDHATRKMTLHPLSPKKTRTFTVTPP